MKKLAAMLCLSALTTGAFAQGLVTFANGPTTLISTSSGGGAGSAFAASPVGSYYFALLTGSSASSLSFTGIYGTNTAGAGRLGPATYSVAVPNWAPQTSMFYQVAGWSASLGPTFNPAWIGLALNSFPADGFFGVSAVASGSAGGGSPVPAPSLPLFGGSGLQGFTMNAVTSVPEPTSMALAGLGAAALLIFRRRK